MIKKLLTLSMVLWLTGCKPMQEKKEEIVDTLNQYNDGIYSTTVSGYGGEFEISMTYQDDKIVDVTVGPNHETPSIGGVAAEQIAKNVKEQNTIDLDVISGATITSDAMYDGLHELEQKAKKSSD